MRKKIKLDLSNSWVQFYTIGFGIWLYVLFHPSYIGPLGFVWGTPYTKRFEVMGSFTSVYFRRQGIWTKINESLLNKFGLVTTPDVTEEGLKFMKSQGYKYSKELDQWYKVKSKRNVS